MMVSVVVLCAVVIAAMIVLAARQGRERRALTGDVRALRAELQRTRDALARIQAERSQAEATGHTPDTTPGGREDASDPSRGSRTLH